jgi:pimeloyl-ACP methyl ester carboxylesterase
MAESGLLDRVDREFLGFVSPTAPRIQAGGHPCQGLYWTPKGERPRAAFIATHYNVDFSEHYIAPYLASRGFGFLGWNTRYRGFEDGFLLEHAVLDIGVGVRWLREQAGAERVIILGNSGGGSLMAAYQAEATSPTLDDLLKGPGLEALHTLPKADLYVSLNAHTGRPQVLTDWMDASVVDETDPLPTDPTLDPFDPDHGPPYSAEFIASYRAAQRARNQRITDWVKAELARLNAAGTPDRLFPLFRCWGDLRMMDGAIDPSDRPAPMCYRGDPRVANRSASIGRVSGLRSWLSMWSLETSRCQGPEQLARFDLPSLVVQGMADTGVFPTDPKQIHAAIAAKDKQLALIPGAHYFEDSEVNRVAMVDLICGWVRERL